jgi:uncharacterized protein YndB with AHSA1/START domain
MAKAVTAEVRPRSNRRTGKLGRVRIEQSIEIARSPDDVWRFIADARNDPEWCDKVDSVEQAAGDGPGPGARYRVLHRPRPRRPPVELATEVVAFDEPHRMGLREEDEDAVFNVTYELEPTADGTRLTQTDEIDWKISRLALPIARLMVSRDLRRQFATVKRLLEADS